MASLHSLLIYREFHAFSKRGVFSLCLANLLPFLVFTYLSHLDHTRGIDCIPPVGPTLRTCWLAIDFLYNMFVPENLI